MRAGDSDLPDRDGAVEIEFSDTGMGISPEKMDSIFTPFFTTKTKGTGLGLAIVQKIIDMHGGRIRVQSTQHKRTSLIVWLPLFSPFRDKVVYAANQRLDYSDQRLHAAHRPASLMWDNEATPNFREGIGDE